MSEVLEFPHLGEKITEESRKILEEIDKKCEKEQPYIMDCLLEKEENNPLIKSYRDNVTKEYVSLLEQAMK